MSLTAHGGEKMGCPPPRLEKANTAYNNAVGSMEAQVLPAARRFKALGAASGDEIQVIQPLGTTPRALAAPELTEGNE